MSRQLSVALVGLGFGAEWVPCYQGHPRVGEVGVCDANSALLESVAEKYGVQKRYGSLESLLESGEFDAVHLLTGIPDHAAQTVRVLESGRHCACAIPMAVSLPEIDAVVEAAAKSGRRYMLMETENYSRTFLHAKRLSDSGRLGELQFAGGVHYQNMEGWPEYWRGLPPMYYSSHGLGPILEIAKGPITSVSCVGSGILPAVDHAVYGNPYPVESALFQVADSKVALQMTCCLYKMVRIWATDRFSIYGDRASYESPQLPGELPVLHVGEEGPLPSGQRGRTVRAERIEVPPLADLVDPQISEFVRSAKTTRGIPLVHEFITAIHEEREPSLGPGFAANLTAAGICAHDSAMRGGAPVGLPRYIAWGTSADSAGDSGSGFAGPSPGAASD